MFRLFCSMFGLLCLCVLVNGCDVAGFGYYCYCWLLYCWLVGWFVPLLTDCGIWVSCLWLLVTVRYF